MIPVLDSSLLSRDAVLRRRIGVLNYVSSKVAVAAFLPMIAGLGLLGLLGRVLKRLEIFERGPDHGLVVLP